MLENRVRREAVPIHLFRHFFCEVYRLAIVHTVTDRQCQTGRQTDRQTDRQ